MEDNKTLLMEKALRDHILGMWPAPTIDKIEPGNAFFWSMVALAEQIGIKDINNAGHFEVTVYYDLYGFVEDTEGWGAVFESRDGVLCRYIYPNGQGTQFWNGTDGMIGDNIRLWVGRFEMLRFEVPPVEEVPFAHIDSDARGDFVTKEPYWQFVV